jgi:LysM repeat protein
MAQASPGNTGGAAAADGQGSGDDIRILRQMIEQQSRQLDVLAQEIARMNLLLEGKTPPPGISGSSETSSSNEAQSPATETAIPKAVAAEPADTTAPPTQAVHIVTKGETLTAIAKSYKIRVADLLKVNKIADVRKLQIGQAINLPPGAKMPESPSPSAEPSPKP